MRTARDIMLDITLAEEHAHARKRYRIQYTRAMKRRSAWDDVTKCHGEIRPPQCINIDKEAEISLADGH